jgi:hypothetical protein
MPRLPRRAVLLSGLALLGLVAPAFSHHGWSWTQSGFFQIEGTIADIYYGNPHPVIEVDVEGTIWTVELAPPGPSAAAGFTEETAMVGDEITAIGNRSQDEDETRMKAVRIIVEGATYDVYPDRAREI